MQALRNSIPTIALSVIVPARRSPSTLSATALLSASPFLARQPHTIPACSSPRIPGGVSLPRERAYRPTLRSPQKFSTLSGEPICSMSVTTPTQHPSVQPARVLCIQSHVVHGHVGNKSAVFPLQLLGLDVDFINSVQFSNHTGYKQWKGTVMSGDELWALIEGLEMNDLCHYTHLLTGYIASVSFLETIMKVVEKLRTYNPNLIYVCDPVMGDDGQLYLPSELVPIYKEKLPKVATVLMPNAFEAEQLTGVKVVDVQTGLQACELLHAQGTETVVITSLDNSTSPNSLTILASTTHPQAPGCPRRLTLEVPYVPIYFTGTGDLFAALTLGWLHKYPDNLATALSTALGGLQAVLKETMAQAGSMEGMSSRYDPKRSPVTCKALELRLVQSQELIKSPPESVPVTALD